MLRGRPRALTALVLSLAIYAVPIVSAHWLGLFGPTLISELGSDRPTNWIADMKGGSVTISRDSGRSSP